MIKKILIGLASVIVLAFIVIYFMAQPKLEEDGSYSPSSLALSLATVSKTDFEKSSTLNTKEVDRRFW